MTKIDEAVAPLHAKIDALAELVEKSVGLRPTTTDIAGLAQALALQGGGRNVDDGSGAAWAGLLGPGVPLGVSALDPRLPGNGRYSPRRSEYQPGVNLNVNNRSTPFATLRAAADQVDVMRRCIEARKAHMQALDWDIRLTRRALRQIMLDENLSNPGKAAAIARQRFEPEMIRLRNFWEKPDRFNQQGWGTWLGALMEEQLVTDAVTVFPRRTMNGKVAAFELIDGATIKPLWDHRGSTPAPPAPAYQQILHGLPRGEWVASTDGVADAFTLEQLVYRPKVTRSFTPYGLPETEQALSAIDLWMKCMQWVRSEFDAGVVPDMWLKTDMKVAMQASTQTGTVTPALLREMELTMNAMLAGNFDERHGLHLLPAGFEPMAMASFIERFKPELFDMIVKLVCMSFAVMPTEIGFPPSSGLGGKGHQEGEANSAWRKDIRPTCEWLGGLMTDLSREWLDMPIELEFAMIGYEVEDQGEAEKVTDSQSRRGGITINEDRAARGLTMYDFEEADEPFIVTGAGLVFLRGARKAQEAAAAAPAPAPAGPVSEAEIDPAPADRDNEVAKFISFARKRAGQSWRDFEFTTFDDATVAELNAAGAAGDIPTIRKIVAR